MKNSISLLLLLGILGSKFILGQGTNNFIIEPENPTSNDSVVIISDFSYYGNCSFGLVNTQITILDSLINISPQLCGFGDSTLCSSIDTFSLGILPVGNYTINIEYHQGSVCPISGFDTIIASIDTSLEVGVTTTYSTTSIEPSINIYPNPTSGNITINFLAEEIYWADIIIRDVLGRVLSAQIIKTKSGINRHTISMSTLRPAIYILTFGNNQQKITKRITKI
ncbi:MAG: T9SS type A sorting domain-containing protein [Saprospiraceae bacterium]|nr:T9SS type A sorting domain-containing protein [Saprospiraceae bacterium]